MKLSSFLKGKIPFIFSQGIIIIFLTNLLSIMKIGRFAVLLMAISIVLITLFTLTIEFLQKRSFYNNLYLTLNAMEQKQFISQMIQSPDFIEGKILTDILQQTTKSMNDEIAGYKILQEEYREYIETWIHEVKIPIACINLICENNKSEVTRSIIDETQRIDSFVEQALYYARSTNVEKDYSIREINLESFVKSVIKKHSKQLIENKIEIKLNNLCYTVFSDPKWLDFIIGQIVSNSIKYKKDPLCLSFSAQEKENKITLAISDNGIGISEKDISKIFDKGFTGENGRKFAKSTGIGLYLCKKLCEKMHLGIEIQSEKEIGTTVNIIFPKDKTIFFES
ncbi:sensor histidine kinase [Clostridium ganghwense]|uniref:histidine kinase n=1 Tax=Clostridium ganghwense TaxID=312089 RepID=A0ABT4CN16_9CLOT|nr:sensor histidine kinase [Clostridium ganghwense]MCY6369389.1 sensor histidine kinase [Clostridium ganghwense]